MRRKFFYLLSFTWGAPTSLVGALVCALLIACGAEPSRHGHCVYFKLPWISGGFNLGWLFLTGSRPSEHTLDHELGHGYQNCILGPFFTVITLMSLARYHYRAMKRKLCPRASLPDYDSVWFEGWASRLGRAAMGRDEV